MQLSVQRANAKLRVRTQKDTRAITMSLAKRSLALLSARLNHAAPSFITSSTPFGKRNCWVVPNFHLPNLRPSLASSRILCTQTQQILVARSPRALLREVHVRSFATSRFGKQGRVDIATRARQLQARRLWTIILAFTIVAGFLVVVLANFQEYLMFYITPTEALEKFLKDPSQNRCRLGGLVLEGSVVHFSGSPEMQFVVTDLANDILVRYKGALPDLFREGHSVVAEGFLRPMPSVSENPSEDFTGSRAEAVIQKAKSVGCYFVAVDVLAKHDEKYMPKEVAAALEKNRAAIEAAHAAGEISSSDVTSQTQESSGP